MASRDVATGMIFLSQTVLGTLGNFSLLYHYLFLNCTGCRLRSTHLILEHLAVANSLVLLSKGVPQTMAAFGLHDFLNDIGCKLVFYAHRVGRGVSIGSTCLLSVFQALTISLGNSRWAQLKAKAPKHTGSIICSCWILQMLVNVIFLMYVSGKRERNITRPKDLGFCAALGKNNEITLSLFAALLSFPDVSCLGVMIWSSGSMVFILHRHKQRVQHIHRNSLSPRFNPEVRATQRILILLSTFVTLYTLSSTCEVCLALFNRPSWLLVNISTLVAPCFPTVSPFLLSHDIKVFRLCILKWQRF
uniref:Vomeronasal type-1 receptor n=1 Tax=Catagonus wagneri TaxID=51154 RepID=A0A8C3VYH3_9CETA